MANPHALVEGVIITCYAIRSAPRLHLRPRRGPAHRPSAPSRRRRRGLRRRLPRQGHLRQSGYDLDVVVHAGAGAYICGEETALLDSLEGYRGQPRLRPPFPAVAGLYASPTVINNVESIASVPPIIARGADWFSSMGTREVQGLHALLAVRTRDQARPVRGPARHHAARAARPGRRRPGGPRAEVLDPGRLLDADPDRRAPRHTARLRGHVGAAGSMLGTKALQIFDETTCVVRAVLRWTEFYAHESCGKCTPCREGTYWMVQILRAPRGRATGTEATSTRCSTPATTSWAGRSAPSVTARPARSPRRSSSSGTSYVAHYETSGGCPFDPTEARPSSAPAGASLSMTVSEARGRRPRQHRSSMVNATIDGLRDQRSQGHPDHPGRRARRHPGPAVLRPPAARPGRRLPAVHRRGRGPAQAAHASCTVTVTDGMVVKTQLTSAVAEKAQRGQRWSCC